MFPVIFCQIWNFFSYYFFKHVFCSLFFPSGTSITHSLSEVVWQLANVLFLFLVFFSMYFIWIVFYSMSSSSLINTAEVYNLVSITDIIISIYKSSVWASFISSVSLLNVLNLSSTFLNMFFIHFVHCFTCIRQEGKWSPCYSKSWSRSSI